MLGLSSPLFRAKGRGGLARQARETGTDKIKRKTARLQVCGSGCVCVHTSGHAHTEGRKKEKEHQRKKEGKEIHEQRAAGREGPRARTEGEGGVGRGVGSTFELCHLCVS